MILKPKHATFPSLIWDEGIDFPSILSTIVVACLAGPWKYLGDKKKTSARKTRKGRGSSLSLVCLPRAPRFFLRPLVPSACYAGLDCRYFYRQKSQNFA